MLRVQDVPATNGCRWIKQGFDLFRKAPLVWLTLSMLWSILLSATTVILWPIGVIMIILFYPVLLAVWLRICEQIDQVGTLEIGLLLKDFKKNSGQLFALGGFVVFSQMLLSIIATMLVPLDS